MLAQSRQQAQVMQEQVPPRRRSFATRPTSSRRLQSDNEQMRTRTTAMAASMQTRSQAEIRPNNSLLRNLTITNLPGVQVRQDGDVVRVELPADQLFNPGTAQIKAGQRRPAPQRRRRPGSQLPAAADRHRRAHRQQPTDLAANADRSAPLRRPVDGRLRRPDPHRRRPRQPALRRRPRQQPPGRLERHRRRPSPQSPHRARDLPRYDAAVASSAARCRQARISIPRERPFGSRVVELMCDAAADRCAPVSRRPRPSAFPLS